MRMCVLHVSTSKPIPHAHSCFVRIHTNNTSLQSRIKMNTNVFVYENELFLSDGKFVYSYITVKVTCVELYNSEGNLIYCYVYTM